MKLIAHRGLYNGPNESLENHPDQILDALSKGFDCEIDVWFKADGGWFLGHNGPEYPVDFEFLKQSGLWIHAKNLPALYVLTGTDLNYFWHQGDDCVLTSHCYIWTYPDKPLTKHSIMLMPEWDDPELTNLNISGCYGICSDYVQKIKNNYEKRI
jgi:hypothetical protein